MKRRDSLDQIRMDMIARSKVLRQQLDGQLDAFSMKDAHVVGDAVDQAQSAASDEIYGQLTSLGSDELIQLADAISRIDNGTYGICEACGGKVPTARLRALPFVRYCIRCQHAVERDGDEFLADHEGMIVKQGAFLDDDEDDEDDELEAA